MKANIDESFLLNKRIEIGTQLANFRKERGLNQEQLAELIGTQRSTVSKIEAGKWNFSIDFLNVIILKLDYELDFNKKVID